MQVLSIEELKVAGKRVLMRVDFNVPLGGDGEIEDATKIQATLSSIDYVLKNGGSLILLSHLGRPKYEYDAEASLLPIAHVLSGLLKRPVQFSRDCIGYEAREKVQALKQGEILLLENLRFHRGEEFPDADPDFTKELASFGDCYVNEAFATSHRKASSITVLPHFFPGKAAAGYLLQKEIKALQEILIDPKKPFYALIGGAKISTKIGILHSLLDRVDALLIGGGMSFTFLKAKGLSIGDSICEDDQVEVAKTILASAKDKNVNIFLPVDVVIADTCSEDAKTSIVILEEGIPKGAQGVDIGPKTITHFSEVLQKAKTIFWNGPLGVFEIEAFAKGTHVLAKIISELKAATVAGGGDTLGAIKELEIQNQFTHLSTGGGASLEFIEKSSLPGIEALSRAYEKAL